MCVAVRERQKFKVQGEVSERANTPDYHALFIFEFLTEYAELLQKQTNKKK